MSAFHRDIIMPAIRLASILRQSTANSHFVFRVASNKTRGKATGVAKTGEPLAAVQERPGRHRCAGCGIEDHVEERKELRGGERWEYRGQYSGCTPGALPRGHDRKDLGEQTARSCRIVEAAAAEGPSERCGGE